jgi:tetratricopeptide (TPR) repeat protein
VTTSSAEARAFFNQGVSQLHSFWAQEAERSFLQAATLDPNMAMAYWGIALAAAGDHRPAFQLLRNASDGRASPPAAGTIARDVNGAALDGKMRAREAIEKAMSMRDKVTPRERLYIESQWARRNPAAKDPEADYIAGLRKLVAAYPDDQDAKSILGLSLLNGYEQPSMQPRPGTLEGIRLLDEIVAKNDAHFGAHHYIIHAYEGSRTPEKAWHACDQYPKLVPNIPHALHMPGHIYAQSNRIDDAVASFTAAGVNELYYLNADLLYPNGHHGHNIHFLIHSLNLAGRYADSLLQAQNLLMFKETPREKASDTARTTWRQGHFALIKTLVRFERWQEILDGRTIPMADKAEQRAWRAWAVGLAQSATGHASEARAALAALQAARSEMKAAVVPVDVAVSELQATIEARSGNVATAWQMFRAAADQDAAQIYTEPPAYPRPVTEAWGNVALEFKDFATADRAYAEALQREPGSGRAYFGRYRALAALGQRNESQKMLNYARVAWSKADTELPEITALRAAIVAMR